MFTEQLFYLLLCKSIYKFHYSVYKQWRYLFKPKLFPFRSLFTKTNKACYSMDKVYCTPILNSLYSVQLKIHF